MDATSERLVREIRAYRGAYQQLSTRGAASGRRDLLVEAHNWATRPSVMRTEREHRLLNTFARWVKRRLLGTLGWAENEDGRLYRLW